MRRYNCDEMGCPGCNYFKLFCWEGLVWKFRGQWAWAKQGDEDVVILRNAHAVSG